MWSKKAIAAAVAAAGLIWGSAHAAPEGLEQAPGVQSMPGEMPEIIILELQPMVPGQEGAASEQEQVMMTMMLLQLLGALQAEGEPMEVIVAPTSSGQRI